VASYFDFDALGSTAALTGAGGIVANRYAYLPFGENLASTETLSNPFEFVGQFGVMTDGSGLDFMRARFYDTGTGRFTSEDPVGILGGFNLYTYAANRVPNWIDPLGFSGGNAGEDGKIDDSVDPGTNIGGHFLVKGTSRRPCKIDDSVDPGTNIGGHFLVNSITGRDPCGGGGSTDNGGSGNNGQGGGGTGNGAGGNDGTTGGGGSTGTSQSSDPNQKLGPAGFGQAGFLAEMSLLPYRVDFENDATATAPAQRVEITDRLDSDVDWSTLQFTAVGFGDQIIAVPAGSQYFQTAVGMTYNSRDFQVEIELALDSQTGQVRAVFQAVDPKTSLPPDVLTGFLPPEDGTGHGMGHFSYIVEPKPNLPTGTEIRNVALIQFDFGEIIATNQIDPHDPSKGTDPTKEALNTIDADVPTSAVGSLPGQVTPDFTVAWSGTDDTGGSGVGMYDVFVSTDGGDFALWLPSTSATSATYPGHPGHRYAFYSVATDNVGHRESKSPVAETETLVNAPPTVALINTVTELPENTDTSSGVKVADIVVTDDGIGTNALGLSGADATMFEIVASALYLKAGAVLDYETNPVLDVIVAVDDPAVGTTPDDTKALAITITPAAPPWQNPRHPCDVTGENFVAPIDVLVLINDINAHGSRKLTAPPTPTPPPFLDPNGDGWIAPLDVLIVINYINAHGSGPIPSASGGEGEQSWVRDLVLPLPDGASSAVSGAPSGLPGRAWPLGLGSAENAGCAAVSRPQHGPDRRSPHIAEETCGRRFRRGRETCAEQRRKDFDFEALELDELLSEIAPAVAQARLGLRRVAH
jgi:RHS repeat-associated protein